MLPRNLLENCPFILHPMGYLNGQELTDPVADLSNFPVITEPVVFTKEGIPAGQNFYTLTKEADGTLERLTGKGAAFHRLMALHRFSQLMSSATGSKPLPESGLYPARDYPPNMRKDVRELEGRTLDELSHTRSKIEDLVPDYLLHPAPKLLQLQEHDPPSRDATRIRSVVELMPPREAMESLKTVAQLVARHTKAGESGREVSQSALIPSSSCPDTSRQGREEKKKRDKSAGTSREGSEKTRKTKTSNTSKTTGSSHSTRSSKSGSGKSRKHSRSQDLPRRPRSSDEGTSGTEGAEAKKSRPSSMPTPAPSTASILDDEEEDMDVQEVEPARAIPLPDKSIHEECGNLTLPTEPVSTVATEFELPTPPVSESSDVVLGDAHSKDVTSSTPAVDSLQLGVTLAATESELSELIVTEVIPVTVHTPGRTAEQEEELLRPSKSALRVEVSEDQETALLKSPAESSPPLEPMTPQSFSRALSSAESELETPEVIMDEEVHQDRPGANESDDEIQEIQTPREESTSAVEAARAPSPADSEVAHIPTIVLGKRIPKKKIAPPKATTAPEMQPVADFFDPEDPWTEVWLKDLAISLSEAMPDAISGAEGSLYRRGIRAQEEHIRNMATAPPGRDPTYARRTPQPKYRMGDARWCLHCTKRVWPKDRELTREQKWTACRCQQSKHDPIALGPMSVLAPQEMVKGYVKLFEKLEMIRGPGGSDVTMTQAQFRVWGRLSSTCFDEALAGRSKVRILAVCEWPVLATSEAFERVKRETEAADWVDVRVAMEEVFTAPSALVFFSKAEQEASPRQQFRMPKGLIPLVLDLPDYKALKELNKRMAVPVEIPTVELAEASLRGQRTQNFQFGMGILLDLQATIHQAHSVGRAELLQEAMHVVQVVLDANALFPHI